MLSNPFKGHEVSEPISIGVIGTETFTNFLDGALDVLDVVSVGSLTIGIPMLLWKRRPQAVKDLIVANGVYGLLRYSPKMLEVVKSIVI